MKKLFAIILAITMMASLSLSAFADATAIDGNNATSATDKKGGDYSLTVNGEYNSNTPDDKVCVDIAWTGMTFTYTDGDSSYDPVSHKETVGAGSWGSEKGKITVTNHSNCGISVSFTALIALSTDTTVGYQWFDAEGEPCIGSTVVRNIASALDQASAPESSVQFALTGTPNVDDKTKLASDDNIGSITVQIAKNSN